jgi:phage FluMu protein Com
MNAKSISEQIDQFLLTCPKCKEQAKTVSTDDGRTFIRCGCGFEWQPTSNLGEPK